MLRSRKIVVVTIILLVINALAYAIEVDEAEPSFSTFFNFYSKNLPSAFAGGRGYTGVAGNGDLSLSIINPAAVDLSDVWEVFYEYQSKDEINLSEYDQKVRFSSYKQSGTFGIGLKLNRLQAGIISYQRSNYDYSTCIKCVYNDVQVDSMNYHLKATITDLAIPVSYQIHDKFRLGASLIIGKYRSSDPAPIVGQTGIADIITGKVDFNQVRYRLGFVASPINDFSIGASVMPEAKKNLKKEYGWNYGVIEYSDNTFPTEINVGVNYSPQSLPIKILVDYNYSNDSVYDELNDRHDYNIGVEYMLKDFITFRTGFFTQGDYRNLDYQVSNGENMVNFWDDSVSYDQKFITGGVTVNWKRLSFNAAVMNSSALSTGDLEQTHFILGTSLNI